MAKTHQVFIHYAAYDSCGVVKHRSSRLSGMKTMLENHGHSVELKEEPEVRNLVEVFVNGICVYKCDIRNLDYGGDGELDPLCHEALDNVNKAY